MSNGLEMRRIRWGMIGGGPGAFIGSVHRAAARLCNSYALVGGVFSSDYERGLAFARGEAIGLDRVYRNVEEMVEKESARPEGDRIEAVTIVTPNCLHYREAKVLIRAGLNVICEKPVTVTLDEALELERLVEENGTAFCVAYAYTGYPMVRQMRSLVSEGAIGELQRVDSQYYQGWINPCIHDRENRERVWRLRPDAAGKSCCIGDIGVHSFNLIEYVTGRRVTGVLARLNCMCEEVPLDVDGDVLLEMEGGGRGIIRASQVATGEENNLMLQLYGSKGGMKWSQEDPNRLHLLPEGAPAQVYKTANPYNAVPALNSSTLPPGHPEGFFEAFANLYRAFAEDLLREERTDEDYPVMAEGVRGMMFIEASVESSSAGNRWVSL